MECWLMMHIVEMMWIWSTFQSAVCELLRPYSCSQGSSLQSRSIECPIEERKERHGVQSSTLQKGTSLWVYSICGCCFMYESIGCEEGCRSIGKWRVSIQSIWDQWWSVQQWRNRLCEEIHPKGRQYEECIAEDSYIEILSYNQAYSIGTLGEFCKFIRTMNCDKFYWYLLARHIALNRKQTRHKNSFFNSENNNVDINYRLNNERDSCYYYWNYIHSPFTGQGIHKYKPIDYDIIFIDGPCPLHILKYISFLCDEEEK